jgi:hypothetical protein
MRAFLLTQAKIRVQRGSARATCQARAGRRLHRYLRSRPVLCSKVQIRRQDPSCTTIKILPCGSWNCEVCSPHRRKQLMAIAASGKPTICLTLTHWYEKGSDQCLHYRELHSAWKILAKRVLRQFKKPPEQRWVMITPEGGEYQELRAISITRKTKAGRIKKLHYMAFAEETKNGEPHLHILLRTVFIPQAWIAQQMEQIIKSPITWIEKIKGPKAAIAYVTKYVTKAPAQFGKSRRYWVSRWYQLVKRERDKRSLYDKINSRVIFQDFREFITEIIVTGAIPRILPTKEIELYSQTDKTRRLSTDQIYTDDYDGMTSYLWLSTWRQRLARTP